MFHHQKQTFNKPRNLMKAQKIIKLHRMNRNRRETFCREPDMCSEKVSKTFDIKTQKIMKIFYHVLFFLRWLEKIKFEHNARENGKKLKLKFCSI